MKADVLPRPEYPEPQFRRDSYYNCNGEWQFEVDACGSGLERGLLTAPALAGRILVPFCPESSLSGVGLTDFMPYVWYKKQLTFPADFAGKRVLLHFGACDWQTTVWVNGTQVGEHCGGYTPFCFDITDSLEGLSACVTVRVYDDVRTAAQPGGKQCQQYSPHGCFYTRTTGIWQTVWAEAVPDVRLLDCCIRTALDGEVNLSITATPNCNIPIYADISLKGNPILTAQAECVNGAAALRFTIPSPQFWTPENPTLYNVTLRCGNDIVYTYFGIRTISFRNGAMLLNDRKLFGRFVLDQGFYPDGIYTAPDDEALKNDILLSKQLGFNGARLHQKLFEPRFLYWCDVLGYLVWDEYANWDFNAAVPTAMRSFLPEWQEAVLRDRNHPAIIGWCPFNETQLDIDPVLVRMVYSLTRTLDPTRLFIDCSGWHHIDSCYDMMDIHDYDQNPESFRNRYLPLLDDANDLPTTVEFAVKRVPGSLSFLSEYGGIWWSDTDTKGWGYGTRVHNKAEFLQRYRGLTSALLENAKLTAFCYTQLYDVEQEQNGLMTYQRTFKFPPDEIASINRQHAAIED